MTLYLWIQYAAITLAYGRHFNDNITCLIRQALRENVWVGIDRV